MQGSYSFTDTDDDINYTKEDTMTLKVTRQSLFSEKPELVEFSDVPTVPDTTVSQAKEGELAVGIPIDLTDYASTLTYIVLDDPLCLGPASGVLRYN